MQGGNTRVLDVGIKLAEHVGRPDGVDNGWRQEVGERASESVVGLVDATGSPKANAAVYPAPITTD
jgi:hypothetical protein